MVKDGMEMKLVLFGGNVLWKEVSKVERKRKDGSGDPIYVPLPGVRARIHIDNEKERDNLIQQLRSGELDIFLPYIKELKELNINERHD